MISCQNLIKDCCWVEGLGCRVEGLGCRVEGLGGLGVKGLGV